MDNKHHQIPLQIRILLANFTDARGCHKSGGLTTAAGPVLGLPGVESWRLLSDLCNGSFRSLVLEGLRSHESRIELLMCGTIGDAPRANRLIQVLYGIHRTHVNEAPHLMAATAFRLRCDHAATANRIRMVSKHRQVRRALSFHDGERGWW